jgi:hypothetical protein
VADSSNVTTSSSTAPFSIDWECHDHDEVSTGRRVATATVECPKTLIRCGGHSDCPIWTEANALLSSGLGLRLNCCKHSILCLTRCEPVKLLLSGVRQQISTSRLGTDDVPSTINGKDSTIPHLLVSQSLIYSISNLWYLRNPGFLTVMQIHYCHLLHLS